ncbi:hypothetical protein HMPREF0793_1668 [Staphylococcus caprae M23864:W1]|nr:hypothetical protein HMPREF0793_1668 [Staphylococcus caprae M23864:W1]
MTLSNQYFAHKRLPNGDIYVQDYTYALEFNLVSLYTIDTAGSNLEKPFNETDMTAIMMLTL